MTMMSGRLTSYTNVHVSKLLYNHMLLQYCCHTCVAQVNIADADADADADVVFQIRSQVESVFTYNPGQKTLGQFWAKSREFTVHASIVI